MTIIATMVAGVETLRIIVVDTSIHALIISPEVLNALTSLQCRFMLHGREAIWQDEGFTNTDDNQNVLATDTHSVAASTIASETPFTTKPGHPSHMLSSI